jgi:hypothetical protein
MSSNAYMLVYTEAIQTEEQGSAEKKNNETGDKTGVEWILPERLSDLLKTEDQKFEDWVKEMNETKVFDGINCIFTNNSQFSNYYYNSVTTTGSVTLGVPWTAARWEKSYENVGVP